MTSTTGSRDSSPDGSARRARGLGPGGFTLVEVLVVLGIISILMAGLIVAMSVGQRAAARGAAVGLVQKLGAALAQYRGTSGLQYRLPPDGFEEINVPGVGLRKCHFYHVGPTGALNQANMSDKWNGTQCLVWFLCVPQPVMEYDPNLVSASNPSGVRVAGMAGPFLEEPTGRDFPTRWFGDHQATVWRKSVSAFLQKLKAEPLFFDGTSEDKRVPPFTDPFFSEDPTQRNPLHYDLRAEGGRATDMGGAAGKDKHGVGFDSSIHPDPDPRGWADVAANQSGQGDPSGYDLWSHGEDGHKQTQNPGGAAPKTLDDHVSWKGGN
ncbi:MAG: prepilin-type N-terminal cleavage/methylation domain-containing protein [Planctomycetes bacterium]|nr:prepilin-type N-terminal cleavage/methylation domain-containing protein [Planctomycetota bacterium]